MRNFQEIINLGGDFKPLWAGVMMICIFCSCNTQVQKIQINGDPVCSVTDTTLNSEPKQLILRKDYYVVEGYTGDVSNLRHQVDSFISEKGKSQANRFDDYIIFLYRGSDILSKENLGGRSDDYKVKTFVHFDDDMIARYYFRSGALFSTDWKIK